MKKVRLGQYVGYFASFIIHGLFCPSIMASTEYDKSLALNYQVIKLSSYQVDSLNRQV